jgi:hypothetical protein
MLDLCNHLIKNVTYNEAFKKIKESDWSDSTYLIYHILNPNFKFKNINKNYCHLCGNEDTCYNIFSIYHCEKCKKEKEDFITTFRQQLCTRQYNKLFYIKNFLINDVYYIIGKIYLKLILN